MPPIYPILTPHEACEAMRANHIPCSERELVSAIVSGRAPFNQFAFSFTSHLSENEVPIGRPRPRQNVRISRRKFYAWLTDFLGEPAIIAYQNGETTAALSQEDAP